MFASLEDAKRESIEAERYDIGSAGNGSAKAGDSNYSHGYLHEMVPEFADNGGRGQGWSKWGWQQWNEEGQSKPASKTSREAGVRGSEGVQPAAASAAESAREASRAADRKQKEEEVAKQSGKAATEAGSADEL